MPLTTEPHQAKAIANNMRISFKDCVERGRFIKGDSLEKAESKLERVIEKDLPVPATKFDSDAGHHSGHGKSFYPVKSAEEVLKLLRSAASNAENEGLNMEELEVQEFITNKGPSFRTPKRHRGRTKKSAHVKIIVGEKE